MTGKPDTAEATEAVREEAAPSGAPEAAAERPPQSVPAGDPEAPVAPIASVESQSVAAHGDLSAAHGDVAGAAHGDTSGDAPGDVSDGGDQAAADHERQLEHDLEELTAKAEKADEYLELAQRTRADFENYRKRAAREAAAAQERGVAKLAKELLPAVDNLDRALEAAQTAAESAAEDDASAQDDGSATLVSGIKLVHADVIAALARAGIERFSPEGEPFDPQQHEAIAQQPVEGAQSGTVVEVYQRGYRLGDVVIRPARVVVAA
jgi:molecular chaperone GrpE